MGVRTSIDARRVMAGKSSSIILLSGRREFVDSLEMVSTAERDTAHTGTRVVVTEEWECLMALLPFREIEVWVME